MRIAHIVDTLGVGGAETLVLQLCRLQAASGHMTEVHALYSAGALHEQFQGAGAKVVLHGGGRRFAIMKSLLDAFKASCPDVVHCHNVIATVIGAPVARYRGVRCVVSTRHGLVDPPYSYRREVQFALASRFCDHVVAVCEAARKNLRGAPFAASAKILKIYNGANPAPDTGQPGLTKPDRGVTFVQVGRLSPPKDPATLLKALHLALQSGDALTLWMVGDGPLRGPCEQLASELGIGAHVRFLGERHDVGSILKLADVFVLSSRSEGLPVSQLEAMASGLPMIVSNVGGMPEVAPPGGASIVVEPGDVKALAAAMREFAENRASLPSLGPGIARHYEQRFTLQAMHKAYMDVYAPRG